MKLLQLNATANWGSTGKIAEGIGVAALNRGWESAIAYGRMVNPSRSKLIFAGSKSGTYLHYAQCRLFDREGLGSAAPTRRLIKAIRELNPDVIQLHNIHDHWLNYPLLFNYLAETEIPVVWTFHDCWAFTGGCAHFEGARCFEWRNNGCEMCAHGHRRSALGSRLHVVAVSRWLEDYARQSFLGESGAAFSVINNGIDVNGVFTPGNKAEKEKMILGVSNVWPAYKGLGDFVKLRQLLPADVTMTLVGLTEKQIASLPEGIRGITRTSSAEELAGLYRRASVFVNPTHNDSFPTVNLEALACGTPVVTYRTGGSPEAVDGSTGIVVEKGNVGALAEAVNRVICNPADFTAEACRSRAVSCFDKDVQFGKYIDLYDSLLKQQHNR